MEASVPGEAAPAAGVYLFGVARAGFRLRGRGGPAEAGLVRVRYRGLEALARPAPFQLPALEPTELAEHQRTVEEAMRRGTILPAPPGVIFRGRAALRRFLADQYLVLDEGLSFLEGHWAIRIHISPAAPGPIDPGLARLAADLYAELRRHARAAVPFPHEERRLLSAAFLVDREGWIQFVEHAEDLGSARPELSLDVTGPWPAYDFVRMTV